MKRSARTPCELARVPIFNKRAYPYDKREGRVSRFRIWHPPLGAERNVFYKKTPLSRCLGLFLYFVGIMQLVYYFLDVFLLVIFLTVDP